ncbi:MULTISPECIES: MarC family protein [Kitasatospora]|uniref:UPF0056 membrane protein n=2 Tax=Kitasatospora TaxID=2063 RepID=A0ABT1IZK7_9ACTN|nr:MarC family protein [Kitasatospora paracochleata]MCP2310597.1 multiple antibiotic resistance protein [Kitasatospora paracochleata]
MQSLTLSTVFVTFFAVVGPPKVLLAFAHLSQERTVPQIRRLAVVGSLIAAVVGVVMAFSAEFVTGLFHISDQSLQLAGGVIFFIYAVALVLGLHIGAGEEGRPMAGPMAEGLRELLLPFIVSPLAITAELVESLDEDSFSWHSQVAAMYVAVIAIDCVCVLVLAPLLKRAHQTVLEVVSRLLGLLLAAVGVELFLIGLTSVGVPIPNSSSH